MFLDNRFRADIDFPPNKGPLPELCNSPGSGRGTNLPLS
jgi:hypothetical protein